MQAQYKDRVEEVKLILQNQDLNRAGQRLLDLTYDYNFPGNIRENALQLRKEYNESKELGKTRINNEHLQKDYIAFLDRVLAIQPEAISQITPPEKVAEIREIGKYFSSRLHNFHFKPISLDLIRGNIIGLVGENGNGKTTLLRMICGDLAIDEGDITYFIDGKPTRDWQTIKKKVAFIPQRLERWYGTAYDNISFEAAIKGYKTELNREKVDFIIHRMGLTNFRELTWTQLSSGYKLRMEIAMALVWDPKILILDEPLANLDIQAQELLLQDLRNLADSLRNPVSIILSSQQLHEVETVADQIIFLKNGKAVFNGSLKEFTQLETGKTYELNGNFSYVDLQQLLGHWEEIKIEQSASTFTISFSEKHTKKELFQLLIDKNYDITFFRDISGSTKKLFSDKY